jgi:hypothetical protein
MIASWWNFLKYNLINIISVTFSYRAWRRTGDMGRHNKLLIDLIQSKAKRVRELIDLPENHYFNEGDRDEIAGWGE